MENFGRSSYGTMNSYDMQRQTYVWNYLDGTHERSEEISDKAKQQLHLNEQFHEEQMQEQSQQMKTPSIYNTNRYHTSRTSPNTDWNSPTYPCHGLQHCEPNRSYSENISPSCMYAGPRFIYQHYMNHGRNQMEWLHDLAQDPAMRSRPSFTSHQTRELEKEFISCQYISRRRRIEIAYSLNLTEKQIKTWFQNRRVKERKARKPSEQKGCN